MLYNCDDFIYNGHSLSEYGFMVVNFEEQEDLPLGMERTVEKSDKNRFRDRSHVFNVVSASDLEFTISIMKNICDYPDTIDQAITEEELREIAQWLTSNDAPLWLEKKKNGKVDDIQYLGLFTNITSFFLGELYGLTLSFSCVSPFGYTHTKTISKDVTGTVNFIVDNQTDVLNKYCYPVIKLRPKKNQDVLLVNQNDMSVLETGLLSFNDDTPSTEKLNLLKKKVDTYGTLHGLQIEYTYDDEEIQSYCDHSVLEFYGTDSNQKRKKYIAYYLNDNKAYTIGIGGYMCLKLSQSLNITIDCVKYKIYDSLKRPVYLSTLGVQDVDYFYWMQIKAGYNSMMYIGTDCQITLEYQEPRKVGAF